MSTYMPKAADIERKWYVLDAAGKPLGRVAAVAADLLRGKRKTTFVPHLDCGDHVIIINADKAVLTGNKLAQKITIAVTPVTSDHLKETDYGTLMAQRPELAMELAVKGMVPDNDHRPQRSHPPSRLQGRRPQARGSKARGLHTLREVTNNVRQQTLFLRHRPQKELCGSRSCL